MIITLENAQKIDPNIEQDDLDAFEQAVRMLTNNNFQVKQVRHKVDFINNKTITIDSDIEGVREGDTIEINYSKFNDGLYVIDSFFDNEITVKDELFTETPKQAILTLVRYPSDIRRGIKKLIEYDKKMTGKIGIKSETISRMRIDYHDVNAADNTDGYPSSLLSFLDKYKKMRWS